MSIQEELQEGALSVQRAQRRLEQTNFWVNVVFVVNLIACLSYFGAKLVH